MTTWTDVLALLPVAALLFARVAPVFLIAPFFGARHVPALLRLTMAAAVALLLAPALHGALPPGPLWLTVVRELAIGAFIGLLASIPFWAAEGAGALADHVLGDGRPLMADLSLLLAVVVFFGTSGHLVFLRALAGSYQALPAGAVPAAATVAAAGQTAAQATAQLVLSTLGLAAPVLVAQVLADVVIATAARATPAGAFVQPLRRLAILSAYLLGLGVLALAIRGELARALAGLPATVGP